MTSKFQIFKNTREPSGSLIYFQTGEGMPRRVSMKSDISIVRTVNSCLNLYTLQRLLSEDEWNRFIDIVSGNQMGKRRLHFSGEPSGFHLIKDGVVDDCASALTSLVAENYPEFTDPLQKMNPR